MVGKKIDCPKCKYRFVVEAPPDKPPTAAAEDTAEKKTAIGKGPQASAPAKTKEAPDKARPKANGKAAATATAKANGKAVAAKAKAQPGTAQEGVDGAEGSPAESGETALKPKKEKNKKLMLGLVLAGVGVAVLAVAAFIILGKKGPASSKGSPTGSSLAGANTVNKQSPDSNDEKPANDKAGKETAAKKPEPAAPPEPQLGAAGSDFTNLLPNDSQHILHVYFKNVFYAASPILDVAFPKVSGLAFSKEEFQRRLGFPVLAIDDLLRAESFTAPWTFTIVHTTRAVEDKDLRRALDLEPVKQPIAGQTYFVAKRRLAWLEELGQLGLGAPEHLRALRQQQKERPLYVYLHNPQMVVFADEQPLRTFLENGGRFKYRTELPAAKEEPTPKQPAAAPPGQLPPGQLPPAQLPPGDQPGLKPPPAFPDQSKTSQAQQPGSPKPEAGPNKGESATPPRPGVVPGDALGANTYMTINRTMKNVLDRLESRPAGSKDKVFFSSVTDMNAARLVTKDPDFQDHLLWYFRRLWDVTQLIQEKKSRIHYLGVTLHRKGSKLYRYKNELVCSETTQAKQVATDLIEQGAPRVTKFFDRVLRHHRVDVSIDVEPDKKPASGQPAGVQPGGAGGKLPGFPPGGGGAMPPGTMRPGAFPPGGGGAMPPGAMPPGAFPPGAFPPGGGGTMPPGAMPPGAMPPGAMPPGAMPPGAMPPGAFPGGSGGMMPPGGFVPPGGGGVPGFTPPGAGGFPPNNPNVPGGAQTGAQSRLLPPADDDDLVNSRLTISAREERVDFILDLLLDQATYGDMYEIARLFVHGLRSQVDFAEAKSYRHKLGQAARDLGVNGLSKRGVPPGFYPPGAFPRPAIYRSGRDPSQRVSWMAGLLPFLGRQDVYNFINFDHSWRDPSNWLAGRMLVPEFLDPSYPLSSRRIVNSELPFELAGTHYVGVAGVGLDAADYPANDPGYDFKRGLLGYESSRGLKEAEPHGLSNTILLIQVPHDGPAGVTPWIAGGGSTLRGVPEKDSIKPFLLSTDKDGKAIERDGKRGTYAVMADGSVRFISAKISDDAFKAMCTAKGPAPDKAALSEWAPEVPPPAEMKKEQAAAPSKGTPPKGPPQKAAPEKATKKAAPTKEKK
jgi:hypothetical protein